MTEQAQTVCSLDTLVPEDLEGTILTKITKDLFSVIASYTPYPGLSVFFTLSVFFNIP